MARQNTNQEQAHRIENLETGRYRVILVSPMELELRGGTLILDFRDRDQDMIKRLRDAHVQFDARAKGIRLSPHLCNNSKQIDALIKLLN